MGNGIFGADRNFGMRGFGLRQVQAQEQYLPELVRRQCLRFEGR